MPIDASRFIRGLGEALERAKRGAMKGLTAYGQQVIADAKEICPKDTEQLADSGESKPATIDGDIVTVHMGFNKDYAAPVHENLTAQHDAGTQAKYLSTPLELNAPKMAPFVADYIAKELG